MKREICPCRIQFQRNTLIAVCKSSRLMFILCVLHSLAITIVLTERERASSLSRILPPESRILFTSRDPPPWHNERKFRCLSFSG